MSTLQELREQEAAEAEAIQKREREQNARLAEEYRQNDLRGRRVQILRELDLLKRIEEALPAISDDLRFPLEEILYPAIRSYSHDEERKGNRIKATKQRLAALEKEAGGTAHVPTRKGRGKK